MSFNMFLIHKLITSIIFTGCFFYIGCYKHKTATIIMLLFVVFDALTIYIESPIAPCVALIIRTVTFILISSLVIKKLDFKVRNYAVVLFFTIIAILNGYVIYLLVSTVDFEKFSFTERVFSVFPSITMILMCVCAVNYNFNRFNLRSTLFLITAFCLAFSDIAVFNAYYKEPNYLFYVERFFTILTFLCFVNYVILENKKREQNSVTKTEHYY